MKKFLVLSLVCSLLTACGFHLRGYMVLAPPLYKLYIQSRDPYGQLIKNLRDYLKMSQVCLVENPCAADTILVILSEEESQQLISVSGTEQTRTYSLVLTVTFQITDKHGIELTPPQSVSETRSINIQSNQILGGNNEATNLYQQMRRSIVFSIMNNLSSQCIYDLVTRKKCYIKNKPSAKNIARS